MEIRFAGTLVATHALAPPGSPPQWLPEHRAATEAIALGRHDRRLRVVTEHEKTIDAVGELGLGDGDYDVEVPDLGLFEPIGPHPSIDPLVEKAAGGHTPATISGWECSGGGQ
ncbi:MAG: hypothetical protein EDR02_18620 [Actinobacteria bacterium]|nr:MAG: hypothetical protein EDR02_18620 [Actinomycetota bacterium]RIK02001.1 MAG: hypothetical protein DCC48_18540 [Acidobacteriota bacterium]